MHTGPLGLVHHEVYLFTCQLSLILTLPIRGGMARLSWPMWLVSYWDGLFVC